MRHLAAAAVLALALATPVCSHAQRPAAQLAITHAVSMPDGGWGWAEAVRLTGVRVSAPVRGAVDAWAGVARGDNKMYVCPSLPDHDCQHTGDMWMLQAGGDYRFRGVAGLAPYVGAGASLERWEGGAQALTPHIHGGLDWRPTPVMGLRLEAQSEWLMPARLSAGMVLSLP
jgi:hypothetical protein